MKLLLFFALTLSAIHAQEPPASKCQPPLIDGGSGCVGIIADPVLAYQTARADALEADNAALKRTNADNALSIALLQQALTKLMDDKYGNPQQLQAKQAETQKALDAARDAMKKACGEKRDEGKSTCE